MKVEQIYTGCLSQGAYFIESNGEAAVIDPLRDVSEYIKMADASNSKIKYVFETHFHADFISGHLTLAKQTGAKIVYGPQAEPNFDALVAEDNQVFKIGDVTLTVIHTPGHTPACLTYVIGDAAFVGDTLFMPDFGTARCDFPGGSSTTMFHSIQKILSLPDETRIFVGHDYKSPERDEFAWETTVRDQKEKNIHIKVGKSKEDFVKMRDERDKKLNMPKLIIPSLQVNMRAGNMPDPDEQGNTYIKVPVNKL